MGYHVSILRTRSGEIVPIRVDEVSRALKDGSRFRMGTDVRGEPIVEIPNGEEFPPCLWFDTNGTLWTKNPEDETVDAMCELAKLLGARVRGDELETYRSSSQIYPHPDDEAERVNRARITKEMRDKTERRNRIWRFSALGVAVILAVAARTCSDKRPKVSTSDEQRGQFRLEQSGQVPRPALRG